ncbi:hypothetical protein [Blastococcus litoris]|uniref:hypothetical protein n=1 Tax=Blastococcus litoris TaxID=2171622 RepID=UPI000E30A239|nr:hypothetical protein [Blastococcus litoris]
MTARDPWVDQEIESVRRILAAVSGHLSPWRVDGVEELLRNDEPQEALLGIAWDLGPLRDQLPEHVVRLIRELAGHTDGVHPAFQR